MADDADGRAGGDGAFAANIEGEGARRDDRPVDANDGVVEVADKGLIPLPADAATATAATAKDMTILTADMVK